MSGARLFAILVAFTAVIAAVVTILATSDAVAPSDPGAAAVSALDRIMGVEQANRPRKPSAAQRARRKRRPSTYRVKEDETPTIIAAKFGLTPTQLRRMNRGTDVHLLQKGQRLRLR